MKKKLLKILKTICIKLLLFLAIRLFSPTWTPYINGENSISELRKVDINGANLEVMIRGSNRNNPILIFVHGGPCCSEIPYVRKYQEELEKDFTIVHYDQRGSGKSYKFGEDYSTVTAATHMDDLIALTEYIKEYLEKEQVILIGHSYGTYIATLSVAQRPDLYQAYVGIGQMSNTIESELSSLEKCITAAENEKDAAYLKSLETAISGGESITPRSYVRKYGFAARKIDDNADYLKGFIFGTEYNLLDAIRFYSASIKYQDALIKEAEAAEKYLCNMTGEGTKEFILFDESAHYPQFEEEEKFYQWMKDTFRNYDFSLLHLLPRQIIHRQRSPMGKILLCQNGGNIIFYRSFT